MTAFYPLSTLEALMQCGIPTPIIITKNIREFGIKEKFQFFTIINNTTYFTQPKVEVFPTFSKSKQSILYTKQDKIILAIPAINSMQYLFHYPSQNTHLIKPIPANQIGMVSLWKDYFNTTATPKQLKTISKAAYDTLRIVNKVVGKEEALIPVICFQSPVTTSLGKAWFMVLPFPRKFVICPQD